MIRLIFTKGVPSCGKSTWAKAEVATNPSKNIRINNDDIRMMFNGAVFDKSTEKLVSDTRSFLIREAIKRQKQIIIVDNVNSNPIHFEEAVKLAESMNEDITVEEKPFYEELSVLIERDGKREGVACVGEKIVRKFWKDLGGEDFKNYVPLTRTFHKKLNHVGAKEVEPMIQDETQVSGIIIDLDGTLFKVGNRSPYSAENCDLTDTPHSHVVEMVELYANAGYKIIFCSGRSDKDRAPSERAINKCLPHLDYSLFMRREGDFRKDRIVKEEIFNEHIKNKYYIRAVIDDRLQVCQLWFQLGLPIFRCGDPDADF